ncbi:MAG: hypothetical protein ABJ004_02330 [Cyclobacteriaceae bacterium]
MKKLALILFFVGNIAYSQELDSTWGFEPSFGLALRSTPMYFFNFNFIEDYSRTTQDYNYERNLQGLSAQPSLRVNPPYSKWSLQLIASVRYDDIYLKFLRWDTLKNQTSTNGPAIRGVDKKVKKVIFEPQVSLLRRINSNTNIGVGIGLVNTGKSYTTIEDWKIDLEFYTIDLIFQKERRRILWELKAHYIKKGQFPTDPTQDFITYSARIAYRFRTDLKKN